MLEQVTSFLLLEVTYSVVYTAQKDAWKRQLGYQVRFSPKSKTGLSVKGQNQSRTRTHFWTQFFNTAARRLWYTATVKALRNGREEAAGCKLYAPRNVWVVF
jgi:hypothetical protein